MNLSLAIIHLPRFHVSMFHHSGPSMHEEGLKSRMVEDQRELQSAPAPPLPPSHSPGPNLVSPSSGTLQSIVAK